MTCNGVIPGNGKPNDYIGGAERRWRTDGAERETNERSVKRGIKDFDKSIPDSTSPSHKKKFSGLGAVRRSSQNDNFPRDARAAFLVAESKKFF
jgi:hypothetical protein